MSFALGAVLGLGVLLVRRNVPESPRWLFIHGRQDEADKIVGEIEHTVEHESDHGLRHVDETITTFLGVGQTGYYIAAFAISNFAGALLLGTLFDRIGRVQMISGLRSRQGLRSKLVSGAYASEVPA